MKMEEKSKEIPSWFDFYRIYASVYFHSSENEFKYGWT